MKIKNNVYFQRDSKNYKKKTSTTFFTVGEFYNNNEFIVFVYYDIELRKKVNIIFNNKDELIVNSTNKLIFTLDKENYCTYKTKLGNIIVKTKTKYIKWNGKDLNISYSLISYDEWIGDFIITLSFLYNEDIK